MLEARFTQVDMHVDEAGGDDQSRGVQFSGSSRIQILADSDDAFVCNPHIANRVEAAGGVHHAAITNNQFRHSSDQFPRIRSSTAMRTAIPFSTWFKMTERCESATSEEISRPRLIGPGCITIASGLAALICSSRSP